MRYPASGVGFVRPRKTIDKDCTESSIKLSKRLSSLRFHPSEKGCLIVHFQSNLSDWLHSRPFRSAFFVARLHPIRCGSTPPRAKSYLARRQRRPWPQQQDCIELVTSTLKRWPKSRLMLGNHDDYFLRLS